MFTDQRLNVVKRAILPKVIYIFNSIPFKIPDGFFAEIHKLILKLICWPKVTNTILKRTKFEDLLAPISKFTTQQHNQNRYGTGIKTDIMISGVEIRLQKQTLTFTVN